MYAEMLQINYYLHSCYLELFRQFSRAGLDRGAGMIKQMYQGKEGKENKVGRDVEDVIAELEAQLYATAKEIDRKAEQLLEDVQGCVVDVVGDTVVAGNALLKRQQQEAYYRILTEVGAEAR